MTTEIAGVVVRYEICGEGEPVLLLHGWGGSVESFLPLTEYLKKTRQVILLDFPGHGQSGEPQTPWAVEDFAGLVAELLERLGVAGCDMLGHSFGGRVAIVLAAKRPQLVKKLVLVDAAGILPKRGISYYAKVYRYKLGKKLAKIGPIDRLFHLTERQKNAGSAEYRALSGAMRAPPLCGWSTKTWSRCCPKFRPKHCWCGAAKTPPPPFRMGRPWNERSPTPVWWCLKGAAIFLT